MATILYAHKPSEPVEDSSIAGLREQQTIVGGYVEYVYLEDMRRVLIVDEEGMLKHLPLNVEATFKANRPILGTAILCDIGVLE